MTASPYKLSLGPTVFPMTGYSTVLVLAGHPPPSQWFEQLQGTPFWSHHLGRHVWGYVWVSCRQSQPLSLRAGKRLKPNTRPQASCWGYFEDLGQSAPHPSRWCWQPPCHWPGSLPLHQFCVATLLGKIQQRSSCPWKRMAQVLEWHEVRALLVIKKF